LLVDASSLLPVFAPKLPMAAAKPIITYSKKQRLAEAPPLARALPLDPPAPPSLVHCQPSFPLVAGAAATGPATQHSPEASGSPLVSCILVLHCLLRSFLPFQQPDAFQIMLKSQKARHSVELSVPIPKVRAIHAKPAANTASRKVFTSKAARKPMQQSQVVIDAGQQNLGAIACEGLSLMFLSANVR
jgi:hypothetical protein